MNNVASIARISILFALVIVVLSVPLVMRLYLSIEEERGVQISDSAPYTTWSQRVAQAKISGTFDRACTNLAQVADTLTVMNQTTSNIFRKATWGLFETLLVINGIAIFGFLYVAWRLRKLKVENAL